VSRQGGVEGGGQGVDGFRALAVQGQGEGGEGGDAGGSEVEAVRLGGRGVGGVLRGGEREDEDFSRETVRGGGRGLIWEVFPRVEEGGVRRLGRDVEISSWLSNGGGGWKSARCCGVTGAIFERYCFYMIVIEMICFIFNFHIVS
jgi:hypothetical protein